MISKRRQMAEHPIEQIGSSYVHDAMDAANKLVDQEKIRRVNVCYRCSKLPLSILRQRGWPFIAISLIVFLALLILDLFFGAFLALFYLFLHSNF